MIGDHRRHVHFGKDDYIPHCPAISASTTKNWRKFRFLGHVHHQICWTVPSGLIFSTLLTNFARQARMYSTALSWVKSPSFPSPQSLLASSQHPTRCSAYDNVTSSSPSNPKAKPSWYARSMTSILQSMPYSVISGLSGSQMVKNSSTSSWRSSSSSAETKYLERSSMRLKVRFEAISTRTSCLI